MKFYKVIFLIMIFISPLFGEKKPICFYVNSYHKGFLWSDKISNKIHFLLKDSCEVIEFDMDSKRHKDDKAIKVKALEVKKHIEKINPDIVIISDDNAAKYLIKPYFRNTDIPILFCGINWTAEEYGFPYSNVKGIIEVLPIKSIFKLAINLSSGKKGLFLGDNTLSDKKNLFYFKKFAKRKNITLDSKLVDTVEEWKNSYKNAQNIYDFIVFGHNSAIKGWNDNKVKQFVYKNSKILSFSTYSWMMPFSMIGNIIKAEEHAEWVANSAKAILKGYDIKNINITINKTWNSYINFELLNHTNIKLPRELKNKFKKFDLLD